MVGPTGSTLFEELGLYYIGPVDGQNIEDIVCVLPENRDTETGKHIVVQGISLCEWRWIHHFVHFRRDFQTDFSMSKWLNSTLSHSLMVFLLVVSSLFALFPLLFYKDLMSDQVVHYLDRQRKAVQIVFTSAGLVGSGGPVQCGAFDLASISSLPKMIAMAPDDEDDLYIWLQAQLNSRQPSGGDDI